MGTRSPQTSSRQIACWIMMLVFCLSGCIGLYASVLKQDVLAGSIGFALSLLSVIFAFFQAFPGAKMHLQKSLLIGILGLLLAVSVLLNGYLVFLVFPAHRTATALPITTPTALPPTHVHEYPCDFVALGAP